MCRNGGWWNFSELHRGRDSHKFTRHVGHVHLALRVQHLWGNASLQCDGFDAGRRAEHKPINGKIDTKRCFRELLYLRSFRCRVGPFSGPDDSCGGKDGTITISADARIVCNANGSVLLAKVVSLHKFQGPSSLIILRIRPHKRSLVHGQSKVICSHSTFSPSIIGPQFCRCHRDARVCGFCAGGTLCSRASPSIRRATGGMELVLIG